MELRRYFAILRRRALIVALTVIAGLLAAFITTSRTSVYSAQSTLYIGSRQLSVGDRATVSQDQQVGLQSVIKTFAQMIESGPIAEAALKRVNLQRSSGGVVAEIAAIPVANTQLLKIRATDHDPAAAQQLANAVADAFVDKIESFEPASQPQPGELPQLPAYVFERAGLPVAPNPTGLARRLVLGGLFGFVVGAGGVFLLEYLDITVKTPADVERRLELPVLGVIPYGDASLSLVGSEHERRAHLA